MTSSIIRIAARITKCRPITACSRHHQYSTEKKARYYTKKHEWVAVNGDIGTVGISQYAQEALGEVVFVQLPDVGKQVSAGEECGALESVKAASEIFSPISGTVTEKNDKAESTPSLINKSCYEDGWLFRLKLAGTEELKKLMDQTAYDKYLQESH
ncbi:PREDICTED: glycine cleavage system H protein-like [Papilio xuthus]|uniref:Glycine cleavage system H protein n=1 Tax=Papilio xuthus TaxID=66420 RepID=A0A194PLJ9_PAPXU|nr:PREDICTED: glycine cleavage system H protein-like [Papilio xuthus]KPI94311.1 Glycine cleavage system H protein, mitochondrial [Papilio xuthus]